MKFTCGRRARLREERRIERRDRLAEWHPWYAWRPVKVGVEDCRWLETIERRCIPARWIKGFLFYPRTEYRAADRLEALSAGEK